MSVLIICIKNAGILQRRGEKYSNLVLCIKEFKIVFYKTLDKYDKNGIIYKRIENKYLQNLETISYLKRR